MTTNINNNSNNQIVPVKPPSKSRWSWRKAIIPVFITALATVGAYFSVTPPTTALSQNSTWTPIQNFKTNTLLALDSLAGNGAYLSLHQDNILNHPHFPAILERAYSAEIRDLVKRTGLAILDHPLFDAILLRGDFRTADALLEMDGILDHPKFDEIIDMASRYGISQLGSVPKR